MEVKVNIKKILLLISVSIILMFFFLGFNDEKKVDSALFMEKREKNGHQSPENISTATKKEIKQKNHSTAQNTQILLKTDIPSYKKLFKEPFDEDSFEEAKDEQILKNYEKEVKTLIMEAEEKIAEHNFTVPIKQLSQKNGNEDEFIQVEKEIDEIQHTLERLSFEN